MRKIAMVCGLLLLTAACTHTHKEQPEMKPCVYVLEGKHEVAGRQGVAFDGNYFYVSGSTTLTKYDCDWHVVAENNAPFDEGYAREVNHIGDIDVYGGELYCGVELFLDGVASNIQIAVYDCETLRLKRTFNFEPESGQTECSGIAVNGDDGTVWMCAWPDEETGRYLYRYDLTTGAYIGKTRLSLPVKWIQGVAYHEGAYYLTADDGDADLDEPDHVFKAVWSEDGTSFVVTEEKALDDVVRQGEIEGLTFDGARRQMHVLYNRGARIILGMPSGFYPGYDHEIHEVFSYDIRDVGTGAN